MIVSISKFAASCSCTCNIATLFSRFYPIRFQRDLLRCRNAKKERSQIQVELGIVKKSLIKFLYSHRRSGIDSFFFFQNKLRLSTNSLFFVKSLKIFKNLSKIKIFFLNTPNSGCGISYPREFWVESSISFIRKFPFLCVNKDLICNKT